MLSEIVPLAAAFLNLLRNLRKMRLLHGKLPRHLPLLLRKGQAASVALCDILPEHRAQHAHQQQAAPFIKPFAENRLVGRQQAVPQKQRAVENIRAEQRSGVPFPSARRIESRAEQIDCHRQPKQHRQIGKCADIPFGQVRGTRTAQQRRTTYAGTDQHRRLAHGIRQRTNTSMQQNDQQRGQVAADQLDGVPRLHRQRLQRMNDRTGQQHCRAQTQQQKQP